MQTAAANQICQWEKKPLEMTKLEVNPRSAEIRHTPIRATRNATGLRITAKARAARRVRLPFFPTLGPFPNRMRTFILPLTNNLTGFEVKYSFLISEVTCELSKQR